MFAYMIDGTLLWRWSPRYPPGTPINIWINFTSPYIQSFGGYGNSKASMAAYQSLPIEINKREGLYLGRPEYEK